MPLSLGQAIMECVVYDFRAVTSPFLVVYTSIAGTAHMYAHWFAIMHARALYICITHICTWTHTYTQVVRNCIECQIWCRGDDLKTAEQEEEENVKKIKSWTWEGGKCFQQTYNLSSHFQHTKSREQRNSRAGKAETELSIGLVGQPI